MVSVTSEAIWSSPIYLYGNTVLREKAGSCILILQFVWIHWEESDYRMTIDWFHTYTVSEELIYLSFYTIYNFILLLLIYNYYQSIKNSSNNYYLLKYQFSVITNPHQIIVWVFENYDFFLIHVKILCQKKNVMIGSTKPEFFFNFFLKQLVTINHSLTINSKGFLRSSKKQETVPSHLGL